MVTEINTKTPYGNVTVNYMPGAYDRPIVISVSNHCSEETSCVYLNALEVLRLKCFLQDCLKDYSYD
jgi:hypothetical protein